MKKSFFDIVDENDHDLHYIASFDETRKKKLWCRAVHIVIYTPDKEIVMQKRASSLAYHPDEVEISVGGGVDAGETPEHAVIRELQEEFGINLKKKELRFIGKVKYNHGNIRNFIYTYAVCLPKERLTFKPNPEETQSIFFITERELRRAMRIHRIKNIGRMAGVYAYWKYLLSAL